MNYFDEDSNLVYYSDKDNFYRLENSYYTEREKLLSYSYRKYMSTYTDLIMKIEKNEPCYHVIGEDIYYTNTYFQAKTLLEDCKKWYSSKKEE